MTSKGFVTMAEALEIISAAYQADYGMAHGYYEEIELNRPRMKAFLEAAGVDVAALEAEAKGDAEDEGWNIGDVVVIARDLLAKDLYPDSETLREDESVFVRKGQTGKIQDVTEVSDYCIRVILDEEHDNSGLQHWMTLDMIAKDAGQQIAIERFLGYCNQYNGMLEDDADQEVLESISTEGYSELFYKLENTDSRDLISHELDCFYENHEDLYNQIVFDEDFQDGDV